jgi:hypothetical protein
VAKLVDTAQSTTALVRISLRPIQSTLAQVADRLRLVDRGALVVRLFEAVPVVRLLVLLVLQVLLPVVAVLVVQLRLVPVRAVKCVLLC